MGRRIGVLGLVNYKTHPSDNRYKVFSFYSQAEADLFKIELDKRRVTFESDTDEVKDETIYLFAVSNSDFNRAQKANYIVSANHRKPIINNKFLRYALLLFFATVLTLGVIGYVYKMNILDKKTEQLKEE